MINKWMHFSVMIVVFFVFSSSSVVNAIVPSRLLSFHDNPSSSTVSPFRSEQPPRKIAYLTFDDGPNRYTSQILKILRDEGARATFFVIGTRVSYDPDITKQMLQEGHYVGLHSMTHDIKRLYNGTPTTLVHEMEEAHGIVLAATGLSTQLVRVPYGSKPYLTQTYRDSLVNAHFKLWDWTIDTYDWKSQSSINSVLQRVTNQSTRDVEVILMHDSKLTVEALPQIISTLRSKGYLLLPYRPSAHVEVNFWHDVRL
ncbi:polysaccharide deacetylase family protein [Ectobacillus sp. sgz5001026]|uniref:polysaccharide deacetylase family protein n=1 Tax=Ectobacillus sp. sgz5001026 TaxID=3242473 RepID=UPI0036D3E5C7